MRSTASILHLDLDAFFAAVEQRDKPSLRGKPVIVGGIGTRGVVSTASYEARRYGVRSAMSMAEARSRCPHAAFLWGRFDAYRDSSRLVMQQLAELSPLIEPLSLDEAFVDLAAGPAADQDVETVVATLRADITRVTEGLTASVGVASSKLMAKIASEINKPDGACIVAPGTEMDVLGPMQVTAIPGVGPATAERLRRAGVQTVDDSRGSARTSWCASWASRRASRCSAWPAPMTTGPSSLIGRPSRSASRTPSRSTWSTASDWVAPIDRMSRSVAGKLIAGGLSARTVTLKVRHHDFETHTRSSTLPGPTDSPRVVGQTAQRLLASIDLRGGLRLIGVGVSGLTDWVQDDLFEESADVWRRRVRTRARARHPRRARHLPSRHGRAPRAARRRLGLGRRTRPGHGALRDPAHSPGPGAHLRHRGR